MGRINHVWDFEYWQILQKGKNKMMEDDIIYRNWRRSTIL